MISGETIKKLTQKYQTTELNIKREYFQHLFLFYFYRQKGSEKVYFKGGTALRMIYQSPRFSEDLDFSSPLKNISAIEKMVIGALSEIEKEGVEAEIKEAKKTSGGYLAEIVFKTAGQPIGILLEISLRGKNIKGEPVIIASDFLPPYAAEQLERSRLVEEKIKALLSRKKPRDFFDLYFILRANLLPASKRKILPKISQILEAGKTQPNFSKELKQFLPQSHWAIIKNFPAVLRRELRKF